MAKFGTQSFRHLPGESVCGYNSARESGQHKWAKEQERLSASRTPPQTAHEPA